MSALEVFHFKTERVRTTLVDGEPWFVAADVCAALALANSRDALATLDDDEKGVATTDTLGGPQQVAIVNEPGLYSLIFRSRKPEAKAFKRWVAHQVLPTIRRDGFYALHPELTVYTFDEVATLIEQRAGIDMDASTLIRLLKAAGVLKQSGAPSAKHKSWFWHTGLTYTIVPHHFTRLMHKVCEIRGQLHEFQFVQARLEADGVGQLHLPTD